MRASFRLAALSSTIKMGSPDIATSRNPRQLHPKRAALAELALDADAAPLRLGDALGQSESQPGTRVLLGRASVELLEFDEQAVGIFGTDSDARVPHFDAKVLS